MSIPSQAPRMLSEQDAKLQETNVTSHSQGYVANVCIIYINHQ